MAPVRHRHFSWADAALVAIIVTVLVFQLRSLYVFPQPDSARWWGDETGQMLELKAELETGVAHIPTALGSSLEVTNGFVRGNSWLAAIFYGIPVYIFDGLTDVVTVGRTVTALLAIFLLIALGKFVRSVTGSITAGLLTILLLVSTRAFFFGSHAARLDIAAGLALVVAATYLEMKYEERRNLEPLAWRWWFTTGAVYLLLSTLSVHLLTTGAVVLAFLLWRFRALTLRNVLAIACGSGSVLVVLLAIYGLSGAPPTLFTHTAVSNQFQSVAYGLPIFRPFSRSVQVANILERITGLWREAPVLIALAIASLALLAVRGHRVPDHRSRFVADLALAVLVAWLLFESPAVYYYMQVLPLFLAALVASIWPSVGDKGRWPSVVVAVVAAYFAVTDSQSAYRVGNRLDRDNHAALGELRRKIDYSPIQHTPVVLAQNPAIAELNKYTATRLMTPHLLSFPTSDAPLVEQLSAIGVDFVVLYSLPGGANYSQEYGALQQALATNGLLTAQWTGTLFDVGRDYFGANSVRFDTLSLYRFVR